MEQQKDQNFFMKFIFLIVLISLHLVKTKCFIQLCFAILFLDNFLYACRIFLHQYIFLFQKDIKFYFSYLSNVNCNTMNLLLLEICIVFSFFQPKTYILQVPLLFIQDFQLTNKDEDSILYYKTLFLIDFEQKIIKQINQMEQRIDTIVRILATILEQSQKLQMYKVPKSALLPVFKSLDLQQKGYLDLTDIYEFLGELTEDQLFVIFRHLDYSKSGKITLQSFLYKIGKKQDDYSTNVVQAINMLKKYFQVIRVGFRTIQNEKRLLNSLSLNQFRQIYTHLQSIICKSKKNSSFIRVDELSNFLSQQYGLSGILLQELKNIFPGHDIGQQEFYSVITSLNNSQSQCKTIYKNQRQINPKLQSQLGKIYTTTATTANLGARSNHYYQEKMYEELDIKKKGLYASQFTSQNAEPKSEISAKIYDKINDDDNFSKTLEKIQKRREQLKRGSQSRQKLMDDVLNRKKNSVAYQSQPKDYTYSPYSPKQYLNQPMKKNQVGYHNIQSQLHESGHSRLITENNRLLDHRQLKRNQSSNLLYATQKTKFDSYLNPQAYRENLDLIKPLDHSNMYSTSISLMDQLKKQFPLKNAEQNYNNFQSKYSRLYDEYAKQGSYLNKPSCGIYDQNREQNRNMIRPQSANYRENILRKAQQEASRKIEQIERKARMRVIQKKSAGYRWIRG